MPEKLAKQTKNDAPFLMPGIGASSSIAYAFETHGGKPADAAAKEAAKLNDAISKYF